MNAKNSIKKTILIPSIVLLGTLPFQIASASNRVDDLRGRWDIVVNEGSLEGSNFIVYINDLQDGQNSLLAAGCMKSPGSETLAPLSMQAKPAEGGYDVKFASTVIPQGGEPFIIQFIGPVKIFGNGVPDDQAGGNASKVIWGSNGEGTWEGTHHDRRRTDCPPVEIPPFQFRADVWEQRVLFPNQSPRVTTAFEGYTDIVSTGMLVQKPDGTAIVIPPYTDVFSPNVDFITSFRYLTGRDGDPVIDQPYTLTLLDALGNPIPGTTKTDVWTGCFISPPGNLRATRQDSDISLAWDPVSTAPDFDPANGIGFYQILVNPTFPGTFSYGSNLIKSTYHLIPWQDFVPGTPGTPDGFNFGVGLNRLSDGTYQIGVESFSVPPPNSPGFGHECETVDFGQALYFDRAGNSIIFK